MGKKFNPEMAEREADKIGLEFAHSNDVVKDMSRAYNVDFSNIKVHTDSAADNKVKSAGKDALAQGNDIFFGKGIFESSDPAAKGLVAHEFAHTMQQGAAMGGEMAVEESAPMGVAQGGSLKGWFKRHFGKKGTPVSQEQLARDMAEDVDDLSARYTETDRELGREKAIYDLGHNGHVADSYATYAKYRARAPKFQDQQLAQFDNSHPNNYKFVWSGDMVNTASDLMGIMGQSLKKEGGTYDLDDILEHEIRTMNEEIRGNVDREKYLHFFESTRLLSHMIKLGETRAMNRESSEMPEQVKALYEQYDALRKALKNGGNQQ